MTCPFSYSNSRAAMSTSTDLPPDVPLQSHSDTPSPFELPSSRFTFWLILCAMILLATNMRAPIVALGSIAPVVQDALNISETQIGWLGAVPMLTFAVGALIAPAIGKRFGLENTLIAMIALLTTGMMIRTVIPTWSGFLIGTLLLTLAIGFANTLAAPVIKQRTPQHIPLITGLFSLTMTVTAGIVAGVVLPLSEKVGWQWALGGWSLLGIFAIIIWIFLRLRLGSSSHQAIVPPTSGASDISMWRTPLLGKLRYLWGCNHYYFIPLPVFYLPFGSAKGYLQCKQDKWLQCFSLWRQSLF